MTHLMDIIGKERVIYGLDIKWPDSNPSSVLTFINGELI
jgi:hypothetical protein